MHRFFRSSENMARTLLAVPRQGHIAEPTDLDAFKVYTAHDQAETTSQSHLFAMMAQPLAATSAYSFCYMHFESPLPHLWFGTFLVFTAVRFWLLSKNAIGRTFQSKPKRYLSWAIVLAGMSSLLWAIVPFVELGLGLDPTSGPVSVVIAAVAAGAIAINSQSLSISVAILVPMMAGQIIALFANGTFINYLVGTGYILFTCSLLAISRTSNRRYLAALRVRYDNQFLINNLEEASRLNEASRSRFEYLANHDVLTGLNNRASFNVELDRLLKECLLQGQVMCVVLVDVDHFKKINDTLGHAAGDSLLSAVGRRVRNSSPANAVVARLGGDEFAVICPNIGNIEAAGIIAQHILKSTEHPVIVHGHKTAVSFSLGVACVPDHGQTSEDIISNADFALYRAKDAGRGRAATFDSVLFAKRQRQRTLEHDLPLAMASDEIEVFFQPQVRLLDSAVVGFEALLRWHHPSLGWVPPPEVVAAAHMLNCSNRLNFMVLRACVRMLRDLTVAGYDEPRVAANISPRDILCQNIAQTLAGLLKDYNVPALRFEIEITEEALLDLFSAKAPLEALEQLGVRLSVDDFGVGYSSLAYLHQLKVDAIKIDKRFVSSIDTSESDRALVSAMLAVGRSLNVDVIAEGIEERSIVVGLVELGCQFGQGYYYSKPMPAKHIISWMNALKTTPIEQKSHRA